MNSVAKTKTRLIAIGFALLFAGSLFWSGCATQHPYPGPVHGLTFDGVVQAIDLTNESLSVTPLKQGNPVVFAWNRNTKFWKNGIPIRPGELEAGTSVRIHFHAALTNESHFATSQYVAHHVYIQVPYAPLH